MNYITGIEQKMKAKPFSKSDIVKIYIFALMINLVSIVNSIKFLFPISSKDSQIVSALYEIASFVTIPIFFSFYKILYDYLSVKKIDFSLIYSLGIKRFAKTYYFLIVFYFLFGGIPGLISLSLKLFNRSIPVMTVFYVIQSLFYMYFFMMIYIKCNNINLNIKKIIYLNKILIKGAYKKIFVFLGITYLPVIVLLIIFKILFSLKVISIDFSSFTAIIIFIFSFRIYLREFELYQLLKSEAIAKGTLTEADFIGE